MKTKSVLVVSAILTTALLSFLYVKYFRLKSPFKLAAQIVTQDPALRWQLTEQKILSDCRKDTSPATRETVSQLVSAVNSEAIVSGDGQSLTSPEKLDLKLMRLFADNDISKTNAGYCLVVFVIDKEAINVTAVYFSKEEKVNKINLGAYSTNK